MDTTTQDIQTINTTDVIFCQKNEDSPLELWVDVLLTDDIQLHKRQEMKASIANDLLSVQVARGFARSIALDEESQEAIKTYGGVMVFCGPSGVLAQADLVLA